jgi:tetratricopeptide (TPR) repeat protein
MAPPSGQNGAGQQNGGPALEELLALGVQRVEQEGAAALEVLCTQHPQHAPALRRHLEALDRVGLLQPPPRLGRFTLLGPLGRGGMGIVHLARDDQTEGLVALKTLPARLLGSERSAERFRREVAAVTSLRHPSIVSVIDAGEEDGTPFLAMEYVEGRTLAQALEDARSDDGVTPSGEPWPPGTPGSRPWVDAVCRTVLEVAEGLHHAHRHGVVHRDVKPENVLLGDDGRARLLDFGLALVAGQPTVTTTGEFTGTPSYAAPEQVSSDSGPVDARTDVHALGATLYELLTLRRPFGDDNAAEVARRVLTQDPPRPAKLLPTLPRDLDVICMTALEKRPERRYLSAASFAADLRAFLDGEPIVARAPGLPTLVLRSFRRRPAFSVATLLALVLLVGAPVNLMLTNQRIEAAWKQEEAQREIAEGAATAAATAASEAEAALAAFVAERERADAAMDTMADWQRQNDLIDEFLLSTLVSASPFLDDADMRVGQLLERAAERAEAAFGEDPRLLAMMQLHLGKADVLVGRYPQALAVLGAALEAADRVEDEELTAMRFEIRQEGTIALLRQERWAEAETWARAAEALAATFMDPTEPTYISQVAHVAQALSLQGKNDEAAPMYKAVLDARRAAGDPELLSRALMNYASALPNSARDQQRELYDEAVAIQETLTSTDDYTAAKMLHNKLWVTFFTVEPSEEDIADLRHGLSVVSTRAGDDVRFTASFKLLLGKMLQRVEGSDPEEISGLLQAHVETARKLGNSDGELVSSLMWWAEQLRSMGKPEQALPLVIEAVGVRRRNGEPDLRPPEELLVAQIVVLLRELGQTAEAEQLLAETPAAQQWVDAGEAFDLN